VLRLDIDGVEDCAVANDGLASLSLAELLDDCGGALTGGSPLTKCALRPTSWSTDLRGLPGDRDIRIKFAFFRREELKYGSGASMTNGEATPRLDPLMVGIGCCYWLGSFEGCSVLGAPRVMKFVFQHRAATKDKTDCTERTACSPRTKAT
jgi:hypothetical protein